MPGVEGLGPVSWHLRSARSALPWTHLSAGLVSGCRHGRGRATRRRVAVSSRGHGTTSRQGECAANSKPFLFVGLWVSKLGSEGCGPVLCQKDLGGSEGGSLKCSVQSGCLRTRLDGGRRRVNPAGLRPTPGSHFPKVGRPRSGHAASRDAVLADGGGGSVGAKVRARELVACRPGLPVGQSLQPFSLGSAREQPLRVGAGRLPAQPSLLGKHWVPLGHTRPGLPSTGPCPAPPPPRVCRPVSFVLTLGGFSFKHLFINKPKVGVKHSNNTEYKYWLLLPSLHL